MPAADPTTPPADRRRHLRVVRVTDSPRVYAEWLCAAGCGRWLQQYDGHTCIFCRGEPRE